MNEELAPIDSAELRKLLSATLPQPVQESETSATGLRLIGGNPPEVVVEVAGDQVSVLEFSPEHADSKNPERGLQLGSLSWPLLPGWITKRMLGELITSAAMLRRSKYRECRRCMKRVPPEAMEDELICRKCSEGDEVGY